MKKIICIALAAMALVMAGSSPGDAFHGGHDGHVGVGFFVGGPVWDRWWGPGYPYYPYYPYYAPPPVVIERQPDTYIQQNQPADEPSYWYFCKNPEGYYPYVKKCPEGWLKVVPTPTQEDEED